MWMWFVTAAGFRVLLFMQGWDHFFQRRIEISTPANSFRNVLEGIDLIDNQLPVYDGDSCHIQYHYLLFIRFLLHLSPLLVPAFYILIDLISAVLLGACAREATIYMSHFYSCVVKNEKREDEADSPVVRCLDENLQRKFESSLPSDAQAPGIQQAVTLAYLYNPLSIVSCVALSTTSIDNVLCAAALYSVIGCRTGRLANVVVSIVCLATAAANAMHLAVLLLAVAAWKHVHDQLTRPGGGRVSVRSCARCFAGCACVFALCLGGWLLLIRLASGDWQFMQATFGFVLSVPDLQPNLGLFWCFFTQVFDHFRLFFIWVFQLNLLVYLFPLTATLRNDPLLLALELLVLVSAFKPYPSLADAAVYTSLLPAFHYFHRFLPHTLTTACAFVVTVVMAPVMWSLWIDVGSANANFFFAITLFYNTAQIFLLTDMLWAHLAVMISCRYGVHPAAKLPPPTDETSSPSPTAATDAAAAAPKYASYKFSFSKKLYNFVLDNENGRDAKG